MDAKEMETNIGATDLLNLANVERKHVKLHVQRKILKKSNSNCDMINDSSKGKKSTCPSRSKDTANDALLVVGSCKG